MQLAPVTKKDPSGDAEHAHIWSCLASKLNEFAQVRHLPEGIARAMRAAFAGCSIRLPAGETPGTLDDLDQLQREDALNSLLATDEGTLGYLIDKASALEDLAIQHQQK